MVTPDSQTDPPGSEAPCVSLAETVYRLYRAAVDGEDVESVADETTDRLQRLVETLSGGISVLFHKGGIYVDGELLRADRSTYEKFADLETFLAKFRCNEIWVASGFTRGDIEQLIETLRKMDRRPLRVTEPIEPNERLRVHYVKPAERVGLVEPLTGQRPLEVRIARYYAACLQTLREFHGRDNTDKQDHIRGIKRIAQVLVHLSGRSRPAMLSLTGLPDAQDEFCGLVLNGAILALLMARRLTGRVEVLRRICFASLTVDAANRPELGERRLPGQGTPQSAAESSATAFRASRTVDEANRRAIAVHEAHSLIEGGAEALAYGDDIDPKVETLICEVARRYTYLSARGPSDDRPRRPDDAVQTMLRQAGTRAEHVAVHLLVDTLGLFTQGMPVELSSGYQAVVVAAADHVTNFHLPTVRLARSPDGEPVSPRDVDLSDEADAEELGYVARRIDEDGDEHLLELQTEILEEPPLDR